MLNWCIGELIYVSIILPPIWHFSSEHTLDKEDRSELLMKDIGEKNVMHHTCDCCPRVTHSLTSCGWVKGRRNIIYLSMSNDRGTSWLNISFTSFYLNNISFSWQWNRVDECSRTSPSKPITHPLSQPLLLAFGEYK